MLLEFPNPKDPQDAEVAKMMLDNPEGFAIKAHDWAVKHAGASQNPVDLSKWKNDSKAGGVANDDNRYVSCGHGLECRFLDLSQCAVLHCTVG